MFALVKAARTWVSLQFKYLVASTLHANKNSCKIEMALYDSLGLDRGTQGLYFLQELEWPPRREAPFVPRCRTSLALLTCLVGVLRAARAVPSRGDENFL